MEEVDGINAVNESPPKRASVDVPRVMHTSYDLNHLRRVRDDEYVMDVLSHKRPLKMMVIDMECINRWNVPTLTPESETRCPENQHSVPVYKLHGICANGATAAVNVYGFFPFIYLICKPPIDEYNASEFVGAVEKLLSDTDDTFCPRMPHWKTMKRVLHYEFEKLFTADDYDETFTKAIKLTLALPQYCTWLGRYFYDRNKVDGVPQEFENSNNVETPTYGVIKAVPYNCLDAATQFILESKLTGFGWISCEQYDIVTESTSTDRSKAIIEVNTSYKHLTVHEHEETVAPMRVMTFDIECGNSGGFPTSEKDPIISVSMVLSDETGRKIQQILVQHGYADDLKDNSNTAHVRFFGNTPEVPEIEIERALLRFVGDVISDYFDPDVIVGHNSKAFDIPYFVERAHTVGDLPNAECWSRTKARWRPPRVVERKRKNGDTITSKQTVIIGRIQLDTMVQMKADQLNKQRSYGLGALAQKYLGCNKDDVGYKMITPLWKQSNATRARLGKYNMKDSVLTFGLFDKFGMLPDITESCRITRTMPNNALQSGQQSKVWAQLLHETLAPRWNPDPSLRSAIPFEIPHDIPADKKIEGATVIDPVVGFYVQPVGVLDFASLYPSIMVSKNICYSTLIRNKAKAQLMAAEGKCRISPCGVGFVTQEVREGLVPMFLKNLLTKRGKAKEQLANAKTPLEKISANCKQGALKVSANSTYGFFNASGGKMRRECMAQSVTGWGRTFIDTAKNTAENEFGCKVIYGDTDSIMIIKDGVNDKKDMFVLIKQIAARVTAIYNAFPVRLEPEKVYQPYLLLKKKHYAGMKYMNPDDKGTLDQKGIESARRDYCQFVCDTITETILKIMHDNGPKTALPYVQDCIKLLMTQKVELHKLVITRSLSKIEYKSKQAHSELAKRMAKRDPSFVINTGERIPYLITWTGDKKALVSAKTETPSYVIEHEIPIDYDYYANHQLKKPLIRIMAHLLVPGGDITEKEREKETERIIYNVDVFRHVPKILPVMPANMGLARFFGKRDICRICNTPLPVKAVADERPRLYCTKCDKSVIESDQCAIKKTIVDMEDAYKVVVAKCAHCRGFDDETPCVQTDCEYSFKRSMLRRDLTKQRKLVLIS